MAETNYINPTVELVFPEIEELIKNKNWNALKDILTTWYVADISDLFRKLDIRDCVILLKLLPKDLQSEVFSQLDVDIQENILKKFTDADVRSIILSMEPDDRTELFEEMPPELTRKLINLLPPQERKEALELLGYTIDSVGRLMTPDYVAIKEDWTIEKTMEYIRNVGKDAETIDILYVVDDQWHLLDSIPIRRLILSDPKQTIKSIMTHQFISINANADQEEAIKLIDKYNLTALPVIDNAGHLLGIVTVDDIIDALREEHTEDFTKFTGIEATPVGLDFITKLKEVPLKKIFRARIGWLIALLFMDIITGGIIKGFEDTIAKYVVLVTFLPVLVDTAGNAGSQSATLVIRALAVGTIKMKDWGYLLGKEILIGSVLGIVMGFGISFMGFFRGGSHLIMLVVVLSMIINVIIGCLIGVLLPFLFARLKKDPATASTPLITTLSDIIGTGIYLGMAYLILIK